MKQKKVKKAIHQDLTTIPIRLSWRYILKTKKII